MDRWWCIRRLTGSGGDPVSGTGRSNVVDVIGDVIGEPHHCTSPQALACNRLAFRVEAGAI